MPLSQAELEKAPDQAQLSQAELEKASGQAKLSQSEVDLLARLHRQRPAT